MDGSALYLSVALLFLAQINNLQLGVGEIVTIGYDTLFCVTRRGFHYIYIIIIITLFSLFVSPFLCFLFFFLVFRIVSRNPIIVLATLQSVRPCSSEAFDFETSADLDI